MAVSLNQFVENLTASGLMSADEVSAFQRALAEDHPPDDVQQFAKALIRAGRLTKYQARAIYQGKIKHLVLGDYRVLDEIGAGGMGVVLRAEHRRMKRIVAIKMLPPQAVKDEDAVQRFYQEVEAAAKLIHPNIVIAFEAGEHRGIHYLVTEYVDGKDLSDIVADHGPMSIEQALSCTLQAARGLQFAHEQGIVHRDVKPGNLLLAKGGTVKVLDMGLARHATESPGDPATVAEKPLTQSGQIMGTVEYMAPEQAEDTHAADHRADIYSLGCTLYRLLTGQSPYPRDTVMKILLAHRLDTVPSLVAARDDVPAALDGAYQKMLAKLPDDRQQSMAEVIADLQSSIAPERSSQPEPTYESSTDSALQVFFQKVERPQVSTQKKTSTAGEETIQYQAAEENTGARIERALKSTDETNLAKPIAAPTRATKPTARRPKPAVIVGLFAGALALVAAFGAMLYLASTASNSSVTLSGDEEGLGLEGEEYVQEGVDPTARIADPENYGLEFDGKRSYVEISTLGYEGNGPFTVEAWARLGRDDGYDVLLKTYGPNTYWLAKQPSYADRWFAGRRFNVREDIEVSQDAPPAGQWTHIAAVWDGEKFACYVNGMGNTGTKRRQLSSIDGPPPMGASIGAWIGPEKMVKAGLLGLIDEVRVSSIARYRDNFTPQKRFEADEHTVALYHFDEARGNKLYDHSGNGHHGKIHNAKWVKVIEN